MSEQNYPWSAEVTAIMTAAGWFPGRRVDTAAWEATLAASDGWRIHPAARAFLTEFGGLVVNVDDLGDGRTVARTSFDFDPEMGTGLKKSFEQEADPRVTGTLFPIGQDGGGDATFVIDESGLVFLVFEPKFHVVGPGRSAPARLIEGDF